MSAFAPHLAVQICMKMKRFAAQRLAIRHVKLALHFATAGR